MRLVLDTNVPVSGLLSEAGPPGWIVDLVLEGDLTCAYDNRILTEYEEVLRRPALKLPAAAVGTLLSSIETLGIGITAPPWRYALPDPDDESFLAVAAALRAPLVTGNLKHYPPKARAGVRVMSPRDFLSLIREGRR